MKRMKRMSISLAVSRLVGRVGRVGNAGDAGACMSMVHFDKFS